MEWNILHISDIHLGSPANLTDDAKTPVPDAFRDSVIESFHDLLRDMLSATTFDAAIISGDISNGGNVEGFDRFDRDTAPLLLNLVATPAAVCIVPGNHDVGWSLDPTAPDYFTRKFARYLATVTQLQATSSLLPEDNTLSKFGGQPLYVDHDKRLLVVCINSAIRCGEINAKQRASLLKPLSVVRDALRVGVGIRKSHHHQQFSNALTELNDLQQLQERLTLYDIAHVSSRQLLELDSLLHKDNLLETWAGYLRVAVIHHHLLPSDIDIVEHKPFADVLDAGAVLRRLDAWDIHLVLSGHKHQRYPAPDRPEYDAPLILGGATVGGYPALGSHQGVNLINVTYRNGQFVVHVTDVALAPGHDLRQAIKAARGNLAKYPIRVCRPPTRVCPDMSCKVAFTVPVSSTSGEGDQSDHFFLFANVTSCRDTRVRVVERLKSTADKNLIKHYGVYDVYGHYDTIIRGESAKSQGVVEDLNAHLLTFNHYNRIGNPSPSMRLNVRRVQTFSGTQSQLLLSVEEDYYRMRMYKAFIYITRGGPDMTHGDVQHINECLGRHFQQDRESKAAHCILYQAINAIVIEYMLRCGEYYDLRALTREIETYVDDPAMQKMTHLCYSHDEWRATGTTVVSALNQ
jgi:3',5'-cyclic AMP phosphodiesterase CpdA